MNDLVERLRSLGEPPDARRARERVWRALQGHSRWRDPSRDGRFPPSRGQRAVAGDKPRRSRGNGPQPTSAGAGSPLTPALDAGAPGDCRPASADARHRPAPPPRRAAGEGGSPNTPLVETLLEQTVEVGGAPGSWVPIGVERWTFAPGPAALRVSPLDGPQWVAVDGGTLVAAVDGQEQDLAPGEALVVAAGQELVLRNAGVGEAAALRGVASAGFVDEVYDRAAISQQSVLETAATKAMPAGASRVVFARLTLPPGSALPPEATRSWTGSGWSTGGWG